ncbi:MAG: ROK family protein [Patescibacteria group bacterium]|jgi:glucokinase
MTKAFIGFDVGGTNIAAGLVSKQGKILKLVSHPAQVKLGKKQIAQNTLLVLDSLLKANISCLGICLAWPSPANMPLTLEEITKIISKKYKFPIYSENDANLFTLAEALIGQGKKYKTVVGITLGTGIGCGVVDDKQIFNGRGKASEFGHVSLNFNGPKCVCGNRGCFEEYAGSRSLKRLAKKYKLAAENGQDLYILASQGNKKALQVWTEFGRYLGFGLIGVVKAYDPEIIVLGGQIAKAYKFFAQTMNKELQHKPLFKLPIIKVSKLKNAAIIAAAFISK